MSGRFVDGLLTASAARAPGGPAVVDGHRQLTYGELDERSSRLAHLLLARGVRRGDRVGLYLDKSAEALVGIYGILKSGASYVPLDPGAPPARLALIAADGGLTVVLTASPKAESWPKLLAAGAPIERLVVLDDEEAGPRPADVAVDTRRELEAFPGHTPAVSGRSESDLAYILYTSGSTGMPKGVMLSHANALAFVDWAVEEFGVGEDDRLSSHAPLHFDLSVFDLYAAAAAGAPVVLVPSTLSLFPVELGRWIREARISVWYSVPSVLTLLVLRGKLGELDLPSLRTILFAGEVFPTKHLHSLMQLLPNVRFANLYGPTETNVCTWYEVPRWGDEPPLSIPIGRPIAGVEVFAVDEDGAAVPPGEVGELYVRGPTVMQGYWGDAERTAATLLPEWMGRAGAVYRTGDLARLDDEGNWIFLGRRDAQIKSRGYRIELGEIEAALDAHPLVVECAVVAIPDEVATNRMKAYVVARGPLGEDELGRHCFERLPRYMAPELWEFRDALPRSSTGKIDRRALADESLATASREGG